MRCDLLEYYNHIKQNCYSYLEIPIEGSLDSMLSSDLLSEKQKIDILTLMSVSEMNDMFSESDIIGSGLEKVFNILTKRKPQEFIEKYKNIILCKALPTGEVNAIVTQGPNQCGYLVLIDAGLLMVCSDVAKLSTLFLQDVEENALKRRFINTFFEDSMKSIELYARRGIYYSFANKHTPNELIDIVRAGRIYLYILKFIVGHEISHITFGHLEKMNSMKTFTGFTVDRAVMHKNEIEADNGSMRLNLDSFPNLSMIEWDIYKEALIAPFLILSVLVHVENFQGNSYNENERTHPSSQTRINNLLRYYKKNISSHNDIFNKLLLFLEKYGIDRWVDMRKYY